MSTLSPAIYRDRPPSGWTGAPGPVRYSALLQDRAGVMHWTSGPVYRSKKSAEAAARAAWLKTLDNLGDRARTCKGE